MAIYATVKKRSGPVAIRRMQPRTLKQASAKIEIPKQALSKILREYAIVLKKEVVAEIRREISKAGDDSSIKDVGAFIQSLVVKPNYSSMNVYIMSDFPYFQRYLDGADPYPMPWLTRDQGVDVVPMENDQGQVIFRTTPMDSADAWIHPGIKKHTFLSKAFDRARRRMLPQLKEMVKNYVLPSLLK